MENMKIKNNKTAVILCGGKGTRLGNIGKKFQRHSLKFKVKKFYGLLFPAY